MVIVQTELWHVVWLMKRGLRDEDNRAIRAFTNYEPGEAWAVDSYRSALLSWTLMNDDGYPVGISALTQVAPGTLYSWTVGHPEISKTARQWLPFLKKAFDRALAMGGYHRIECYVLEGFDGAKLVMRHLGMQYEGTRKAVGADRENALLYGRVQP